jgi:hypothetical protein
VDVLVSGSERAGPRLRLRLPQPPVRVVATGLVVALVAGLAALGPVRHAEQRAVHLGDLRLRLEVSASSREQGGGLFGVADVVLLDPRGDRVVVRDLLVAVPGLVHAPLPGRPVPVDRGPAVLRVRFVVPECRRLDLPGEVVLRAARAGRPEQTVRRPVVRGGAGRAVDGTALLVACGRAPRPPQR